ncbi:hypothetical protein, partial [Salmonella enterica]|uniref:hypothetical protein n=1 Tax=Salmonella enterica TaxID=28901 RepID=UPI00398C2666
AAVYHLALQAPRNAKTPQRRGFVILIDLLFVAAISAHLCKAWLNHRLSLPVFKIFFHFAFSFHP